MRVKLKTIHTAGRIPFLKRLSLYLKDGSSIKLHLILHDDLDEPHSHPWDFSSLILFGGYKEGDVKYSIGDINMKKHYQTHQIKLLRFMGFRVPTLTIGIYTEKLTLCSFCQDLGYCRTTGKPL